MRSKDRARVLEMEYKVLPRAGLSAEQWIRSRIHMFVFSGIIIGIFAGVSLGTVALVISSKKTAAQGNETPSNVDAASPIPPASVTAPHSPNKIALRAWIVSKAIWARNFIVKQDRWLSVVGVGLALITFIVKDAKGDGLKDLMNSLNASRSQFLVRRNLYDMENGINYLTRNREPKDGHKVSDPAKLAPDEQATYESLDRYYEVTLKIYSICDLLRDLAEKFPDAKSEVGKVEILVKRLDEIDARRSALKEEFFSPDRKGRLHSSDDALRHAAVVATDLDSVAGDVYGTERAVLDDAKAVLTKKRQEFERYTHISYVAFGLGWFLNLIGKIFGVKIEPSAEA
jgi:hypothetical protein